MNEHYKNKIQNLKKTIPNSLHHPIELLEEWLQKTNIKPQKFKLKPITIHDLRRIIKRLKEGMTQGPDEIPSSIIKVSSPLIEDALLHTVKTSIKTNTFPELCKDQEVFPTYKKGPKEDKDNCRPVNHLNKLSKVEENAVYEQLVDHHIRNSIFHEAHHGAIPELSPQHAIYEVMDKLLDNMDKKITSSSTLLDQKIAFDLIDHEILLKKIQ